MASKREKIDVSSERKPLQDKPFAALLGLVDTPAPVSVQTKEIAPPNSENFSITRTRKGGYPIHLEKRGGGKCVTVVSGLSGNLPQLLKNLRKLCGSGGALREDGLELQGDHREKLEAFFEKNAKL